MNTLKHGQSSVSLLHNDTKGLYDNKLVAIKAMTINKLVFRNSTPFSTRQLRNNELFPYT